MSKDLVFVPSDCFIFLFLFAYNTLIFNTSVTVLWKGLPEVIIAFKYSMNELGGEKCHLTVLEKNTLQIVL